MRKKIKETILGDALEFFMVDSSPSEFEALGEKALPEGYVDIFIKPRHPSTKNKYLLTEVKTGKAQKKDVEQLRKYVKEFGDETVGGILIARDFSKSAFEDNKILPVRYHFEGVDPSMKYSYEELLKMLKLEVAI